LAATAYWSRAGSSSYPLGGDLIHRPTCFVRKAIAVPIRSPIPAHSLNCRYTKTLDQVERGSAPGEKRAALQILPQAWRRPAKVAHLIAGGVAEWRSGGVADGRR